ncbi:glycosyltransferase [Sphingomonas sp. BIUV-7]|uniref:Glycosyltransferase n=1 Tax=Sphingomonas natans TaxID=3063330 RepID=A0ABT8YE07_9SPHN|nr:glycosyltransferase [Sphingomonas sp. BIUV-7]MDO6416187.1 glycosyltransferase [Sphingomonas sp. BIUV-7]
MRSNVVGAHQWCIRSTIRLGRRTYLSFHPAVMRNALRRMMRIRREDTRTFGSAERKWLRLQLQKHDPDIVLLAFGACAFAKELAQERATIVALRGFFTETERKLATSAELHVKFLAERDAELAAADLVTFNNKADVQSYEKRTGRRSLVVGMGFPHRSITSPRDRPIVLFVGADTSCNRASLRWFIDRCWPAIHRAKPGAYFRIVGSVCRGLAATQPVGIVTVGPVGELQPEYASAHVVVAPLVSGSNGVKTKVVEALSYGRALVTTSLGVEREDRVKAGNGLVIADDADQFADAVSAFLADPALRAATEAAAEKLFKELYSEHAAYDGLLRFFDR